MIDMVMVMMLVQIMIESLPISSSGHSELVMLYAQKIGIHVPAISDACNDLLHIPTMLIIAVYFRTSWFSIIKNVVTACAAWRRNRMRRIHKKMLRLFGTIIAMVVGTDAITGICYIILKAVGKPLMQTHSPGMLLIGFITTALLLSSLYLVRPSVQQGRCHWLLISSVIGVAQAMALLPGISRFAVTVVAAQWMGMSSRRAVQFSFACFFPLIFAAVVVHGAPLLVSMPAACVNIQFPYLVMLSGGALAAYVLFWCACTSFVAKRVWPFVAYMTLPIACTIYLIMSV